MKVLERKELPTAIVNCPHCDSKLEIECNDIWWHRDIDEGVSPYVTCAVCHKGFDVSGCKDFNNLF